VEELWDSMCQAAITLTTKALSEVQDAQVLLKIKGFIALFVQTMEVSCQSSQSIGWKYYAHGK
jgi:hypothetical protein